MSAGKAAAQAGHAFLDSYLSATPDKTQSYVMAGGTKIVLSARNESVLRSLHAEAHSRGLPCSLIVDSGHVHEPDFNGQPIVTAVGLGPLTRAEARPLTKRFSLMK